MIDIDKQLFINEHGYDPTDDHIPHMVQVCNQHHLCFLEWVEPSYAKAIQRINFEAERNPQLIESQPLVFKVLNVSGEKPKFISRVISVPESMAN